jgi:glycosyltransferase involved in cell wall biosynthesis
VAPSRFLKERFVAWGLAADRIDVIANGVPELGSKPAAANKRPRRTFGIFGSIAPHKGTLHALAAITRVAAEVAGATLRLHGGLNFPSDAFRRNFETTLCEAGEAATHSGPYRREALPELMAEVDWLVVPSTWWENAPLVILEAFRHKRPVICSGIGGMAELVADGANGLHVRTGDVAALARAMRRAAEEDGLWERLVAGIPAVPTIVDTVNHHLTLYSELLERREARTA